MENRVLIVDDDVKLCRMLTRYLGEFSYVVDSLNDPSEVEAYLASSFPSIIVLDVMMPKMNGFELCRRIRKISDIPVIMLSARGSVEDRIAGLESGADDYLAKPFEPRELVARISAILKRSEKQPEQAPDSIFRFGDLKVDTKTFRASLNDGELELTRAEFLVLALMVRNPYRVLDRDRILNELKGIDCEAFNRTADVTVSRLRTKLGDDPKNPKFIRTVWGEGYIFIAEK
ncbi:response regulator transcription factor [Seleniivibrio sp.]|uniref:response regulator transcription factor n=1 Tax=Seleniivibrio sp. TaxID=2898801 RepID=UPI0025FE321C|nr:response regulator transcription factor [Seleniivibrio sp.]MCD8555003.1 response regulator transcription factor [Seleniivibrio sp.]